MKVLKGIREKVGENNFQIMSILSGLLVMMLVFSLNSKYFFTSNNLLTIALQTSMIAIIALGQTFVLITAGIDLSIGSNMAIAGVVSAMALKSGMPLGVALGLGLLAGVLVGLINGGLIAYGDLPPFVVTLGSRLSICFKYPSASLNSISPPTTPMTLLYPKCEEINVLISSSFNFPMLSTVPS